RWNNDVRPVVDLAEECSCCRGGPRLWTFEAVQQSRDYQVSVCSQVRHCAHEAEDTVRAVRLAVCQNVKYYGNRGVANFLGAHEGAQSDCEVGASRQFHQVGDSVRCIGSECLKSCEAGIRELVARIAGFKAWHQAQDTELRWSRVSNPAQQERDAVRT